MRRVLLSVVLALLFVFLTAAGCLINGTISAFADCVSYNPGREPGAVVLVGKMNRIKKDGDWLTGDLRLCGGGWRYFGTVKIFVPQKDPFFNLGEEIEYQGTVGYQSHKVSTAEFETIAGGADLLTVKVEKLGSERQVRDLFADFEKFNCEGTVICRSRIDFVQVHGQDQLEFLTAIENKQILALLKIFLTGKAVVFSQQFGKIYSIGRFETLKGLL